MSRRASSTARIRGRHQSCAQAQEVVGLDDDRVPGSLLLAAASPAGRGQAEDLTADHQSRVGGASAAICSRMTRISSRSAASSASRRTSSRRAGRARRLTAASRRCRRGSCGRGRGVGRGLEDGACSAHRKCLVAGHRLPCQVSQREVDGRCLGPNAVAVHDRLDAALIDLDADNAPCPLHQVSHARSTTRLDDV
jgi:hypothetical protein